MRNGASPNNGFRLISAVLLLTWMVLGYVGAGRRMEHDRFEEYLGTELEGFDPMGSAVIGLSPDFVLAVNVVTAAAAFAVLLWVTSVLHRSASMLLHYLISIFTLIILVISAVMAGAGLVESLFWSFWTFAAHHALWLLFVGHSVWNLWKKVQTQAA